MSDVQRKEESAPEVRLQGRVGVVDHGAQTVDAGAGQSATDALLHDVETVVHHAGGQLTSFVGVHCNSLKRDVRSRVCFEGGGLRSPPTLLTDSLM